MWEAGLRKAVWCLSCRATPLFRAGEGSACKPAACQLVISPTPCTPLAPSSLQYEIELFLKVAESLGWASHMLNWTCGSWDDNVADLSAPQGTCDIAVMGMTIRQEYLDKNFTFTWPTLK